MANNPVKKAQPKTRYPLDEVTSGKFIYEALRAVIAVILIIVCTYVACNFHEWIN